MKAIAFDADMYRHISRGKRVYTGEWVVGFFDAITKGEWLDPIENGYYITTYKKLDNGEIVQTGRYEIYPATLGQCTGLTAAKSYRGDTEQDRLVFEGDIIRWGHIQPYYEHPKRVAIVQFSPDLQYNTGCHIFHHGSFVHGSVMDRAVEIVNTIHDKPELLEV